jgi:adhesin transport system membrane fusion protein
MSHESPYRTAHDDQYEALPVLHDVRTPRPLRTLARLLAALFLTMVVLLIVTPWQQTAFGEGRVVGFAPLDRQQLIEAPIDGRVVRWHVREGSQVRAGDPIVDISDNDPEIILRMRAERDAVVARVATARDRVAILDGRVGSLDETRRAAVEAATSRVAVAQQRTRQAERALEAARAASATSRLNRDRQVALSEQGLASSRTAELAELELTRLMVEVDRAQAALTAARSEQSAMLSDQVRTAAERDAATDDARSTRATALADIARGEEELQRLDVRLSRQAAQSVVASRNGTIQRLLVAEGGEMVKGGEGLAVFVPEAPDRAVELWISGNDAPLVTPGRHIRLQLEGWPALQFSGWPQVAIGTFGGVVAIVDPVVDGRGKLRVIVRPAPGEEWPDPRYLRQGARAHAWVLLDRVRLGYELWRQFNGFPPSVSQAPEGDAKGGGKGGKEGSK